MSCLEARGEVDKVESRGEVGATGDKGVEGDA